MSKYFNLILVWVALAAGLLVMSSFLADENTLAGLTPNTQQDGAGDEPAPKENADAESDEDASEEDSAESDESGESEEGAESEEGDESEGDSTEG